MFYYSIHKYIMLKLKLKFLPKFLNEHEFIEKMKMKKICFLSKYQYRYHIHQFQVTAWEMKEAFEVFISVHCWHTISILYDPC